LQAVAAVRVSEEGDAMSNRKIDLDELKRRFAPDKTCLDLAAEMNLRPAVIRHALKKLGLEPRSLRGRGRLRGVGGKAASARVQKPEAETAIVDAKTAAVPPAPLLGFQVDKSVPVSGHGAAHCRVAILDVTGNSGEVMAAIEAVKSALQR
jgi:hypothetical protein